MAPLKPRPLYKRIYWWVSFLSRQTAFVICLLPAYCVFFYHYISCDRIAIYYKNVDGEEENETDNDTNSKKTKKKPPYFSRNYVDVYGSKTSIGNKGNNTKTSIEEDDVKKPVVIFIVGGAWTIGYKMWGCLLARALVPFGILVIIPDYRNYPKTDIQGMVNDVDMSIQWVINNASRYGGDNKRVVLVGQSAGAHLAATVVARKVLDYLLSRDHDSSKDEAKEEASHTKEELQYTPLKSTYNPWQLCGLVSTSGPLNLVAMEKVLHNECIVSDKKQMKLFLGEGGLRDWSPYQLLQHCHDIYNEKNGNDTKQEQQKLKDLFPKICIIQGTADKTVPESEASSFISLLSNLDIPVVSKVYDEWSHTDPILEKPMAGNHTYHADIHELVCLWTTVDDTTSAKDDNGTDKDKNLPLEFDLSHPILRPICPLILVNAGRYCNPF